MQEHSLILLEWIVHADAWLDEREYKTFLSDSHESIHPSSLTKVATHGMRAVLLAGYQNGSHWFLNVTR